MKSSLSIYLRYVALFALIYIPVFGFLDALPLRIFDEARLAMNAYHMLQSGNLLVTYFEGGPDMWSTKPPLMIWIQTLFMKIGGVSVLSVRLPSAIAALMTCVTFMVFSKRYLKSVWFGFIAVLVLITCGGYIDEHATRTADYDSLLTLFTTNAALFFFIFMESKKNKYLYVFFLFVTLSVYTKGVAGLFFAPAYVVYSIWQKQLIPLLKNKHFYIGVFSFLIVVLTYYFIREMYNPGYLKAVYENELGGRFYNKTNIHKFGFWNYYYFLVNFRMVEWYLLVPCGLLIGLLSKKKEIKRLTLFSFLVALSIFLVVSSAETKLIWYILPIYPFLSILVAVAIYFIFHQLKNLDWANKQLNYNVIPIIFLFMITINPYVAIIDKTYKPEEYDVTEEFYEIGYHLRDAVKEKINLDGQRMLFHGYNAHNDFYLRILQDRGVDISFKDWKKLDVGDRVFANQKDVKNYVEKHYIVDTLEQKKSVMTYEIMGKGTTLE